MIQPHDEDVHRPDGEADWQENFLFHGWDDQFLNGFYLHLQYLPGQSLVDVRAGVALDGEMTTLVMHSTGDSAYDAPGLKVELVEPFKHIRLRYEGLGRRGADSGGWFFSGEGDTPFVLEVDMRSEVEPISWLDFIRDMFPDDNTGAFIRANHYETGVRWEATIRVGQIERRVTGLAWRDHSWGPRKFFADRTFWNPMVLDEGRTFVSAMTILYGGKWRGFAVESAVGKPPIVLGNYWARPHGALRPGGFEMAESVGFGDGAVRHYRFDVARFIPAPRNWTVSGQGSRGIVDVVSRVASEGRMGIGTFQFSPFAIENGS